jgi:hypothetical protein
MFCVHQRPPCASRKVWKSSNDRHDEDVRNGAERLAQSFPTRYFTYSWDTHGIGSRMLGPWLSAYEASHREPW